MACKDALSYSIIHSTTFHYNPPPKKIWASQGGVRDLMPWPGAPRSRRERQGEGKAQLLPGKMILLWLQASCQLGERGPVGAPLQFARARAIALSSAKCFAELPVPGEKLLLSAAAPPSMQCQGTGGREGGRDQPSLAAEPR